MGDIIDLDRKDSIYRCNHVKLAIVWINLIGPPFSLLFLFFSIIRMIIVKKRKSFLTNIILIIFFSEIIQSLSKLLQLLKYDFPDERNNKTFLHGNTPRGIICQIQITSAMFSDFCSLLSTLLLSLRCYDVIKNKKRFFDKGKNGPISIIVVIIASIVLSISFLFIDKKKTSGNISYRYDLRDRCSYWCWLEHVPSLFCLGLYWVILLFNIIFACKTHCYLRRGYKKLLEENQLMPGNNANDMNDPLNEDNNNSETKKELNARNTRKKSISLTSEEKKRIEQLKLMRIKCLIYPSVTIGYWVFAATYRISDDSFMMKFDSAENPYIGEEDEQKFFNKHPFFQFVVQFFFVMYTFFSSIKGILYGFSFLVFEEKIFFNFFKRCFKRCYKDDFIEIDEEGGKLTTSGSSTLSDLYISRGKEEEKDDNNSQKIEMNECRTEQD